MTNGFRWNIIQIELIHTGVQNEKERRLSFLRGVYTRVYKNGALFLKEAVHTGV